MTNSNAESRKTSTRGYSAVGLIAIEATAVEEDKDETWWSSPESTEMTESSPGGRRSIRRACQGVAFIEWETACPYVEYGTETQSLWRRTEDDGEDRKRSRG